MHPEHPCGHSLLSSNINGVLVVFYLSHFCIIPVNPGSATHSSVSPASTGLPHLSVGARGHCAKMKTLGPMGVWSVHQLLPQICNCIMLIGATQSGSLTQFSPSSDYLLADCGTYVCDVRDRRSGSVTAFLLTFLLKNTHIGGWHPSANRKSWTCTCNSSILSSNSTLP